MHLGPPLFHAVLWRSILSIHTALQYVELCHQLSVLIALIHNLNTATRAAIQQAEVTRKSQSLLCVCVCVIMCAGEISSTATDRIRITNSTVFMALPSLHVGTLDVSMESVVGPSV